MGLTSSLILPLALCFVLSGENMRTVQELVHRMAYVIYCHEMGGMWNYQDRCYQIALTYFWTVGEKVADKEIEALVTVATAMSRGEESETFGKLDFQNYRFE